MPGLCDSWVISKPKKKLKGWQKKSAAKAAYAREVQKTWGR